MGKPKTKPGTRGPVRGAPPTLEWVAIDRLQVDPDYQRATDGPHSRMIIFGMVKQWDWALCQPLVVSRRGDGSLFILDGQHRHAGATARDDLPHLPCVILSDRDLAGEAEAFVALNTKRQRLSQADVFNGMLAAGDPNAKAVAAILTETGWRIRKSCNTQIFEPGDLVCAPMLSRAVRTHGEAAVRNSLAALREAYPEKPVTKAATLLKALLTIYRDELLGGGDPDAFIESLAAIPPDEWTDEARDHQRLSPMLSFREAMVAAIIANFRECSSVDALAA